MKSPEKSNTSDANAGKRAMLAGLVTLGVVVAGGVFFLFDPARGGFFPVCLFHKLTGLNCPGCGGLRALHHLMHGEVATAFHYNPLLMILLPVLVLLGLRWLARGGKTAGGNSFLCRPGAVVTLLAVTIIFTILRNLPWPAFAWMSP